MFFLGYNGCMKQFSLRRITNRQANGFTVLELLIIIGILCVLLALVLAGLDGARKNSRNEKRVANIQTVALGLAQYHDACRSYPASLDVSVTHDCLGNQSIRELMHDIETYRFNQSGSEYVYVSLADPSDPTTCIGYHLGVALEGQSAGASAGKAGFDSTTAVTCDDNQGHPFNGAGDWFDLHK